MAEIFDCHMRMAEADKYLKYRYHYSRKVVMDFRSIRDVGFPQ